MVLRNKSMEPKHPIQELLKIQHSHGAATFEDIKVVIVHRGTISNEKVIAGRRITEVHKGFFEYENDAGERVHIPAHRIKRIEYS